MARRYQRQPRALLRLLPGVSIVELAESHMVLRQRRRLRADAAGAGRRAATEESRSPEDDPCEPGGDCQSRVSSSDCSRAARRRSVDGCRASRIASGARVQARKCDAGYCWSQVMKRIVVETPGGPEQMMLVEAPKPAARSEGRPRRHRVHRASTSSTSTSAPVCTRPKCRSRSAARRRARSRASGARSPRSRQATASPTRWCAAPTRSTRSCRQRNSSRSPPESISRRQPRSCCRARPRTT